MRGSREKSTLDVFSLTLYAGNTAFRGDVLFTAHVSKICWKCLRLHAVCNVTRHAVIVQLGFHRWRSLYKNGCISQFV